MKVRMNDFGKTPDDKEIKLFRFESRGGLEVKITNFGACITSILMHDRHGNKEEITAGFDTLEEYLAGHPFFGVTVGRFANRIAQGVFRIGNTEYHLPVNNGPNHLHGGPDGFHVKHWKYDLNETESAASLALSYSSPDLEQGYPGNVDVVVTYTVNDSNEIDIRYEATTDKSTHVNLTNHTYFNLNSFRETVHDHHLMVNSDFYLETDRSQIPTGKLISCAETPFYLKKDILLSNPLERIKPGLDHCFVLNQARNTERSVARLSHQPTGRMITVYTTQPGIQVYTGNNLDGTDKGHHDTLYRMHTAICLETQHYPDTPNHPGFPSTLLQPGEKYDYKTRYSFSILR